MTKRSASRTALCRKCGEPLAFVRKEGKPWPVNPDGSDHWDRCKEVRHRRAMTGVRVTTAERDTWRGPDGDFDVRRTHTTWVEGADYREDRCTCGLPPWEPCRHSIF
jgi:hypothetical protein